MRLSFCCVSYNHGKYISKTIKSIVDARLNDIEIIIVDDGSSDNSQEIINDCVNFYKNYQFKVIFQKNTGNIGKNFNKALSEASGDYITFIALDDYYISKELAEGFKVISSDPSLAFVTHNDVIPVDDTGKEILGYTKILTCTDGITVEDLLNLEYSKFGSFYLQGCIFRTDVIRDVGGFDEDMLGDDIVLRTKVFRYLQAHHELNFVFLPRPVCCYRRHQSNISGNSVRQFEIVSQYLERYWHNCEPPEILYAWSRSAINNVSADKVFDMLSFNQMAAKTLRDTKTQKFLLKKLMRSNPFMGLWFSLKGICYYLVRRERPGNHERVIVLFSFIRLKYRKHK